MKGEHLWKSKDNKVTFEGVQETNGEYKFKLTIAAGAALGSGNNASVIEATSNVTFAGVTQPMKITLSMPQTASYPEPVLKKMDAYWDGKVATFTPKYTIVDKTEEDEDGNDVTYKQVTAVNFTFDLANLFNDFTNAKDKITTQLGGVLELKGEWTDTKHPQAVTVNGQNVMFDKTKYDQSYGKVSVTARESYGGHEVNNLSGDLAVYNISGTMTQGQTAIEVSDLRGSYNAFTGWKWADVNGIVMWADGSADQKGYASNGLTMNGLSAPELVFANANDANNSYITITSKTEGTFEVANKDLKLSKDVVVRLRVKASSRWGAITGYDANNVITVTLKASGK